MADAKKPVDAKTPTDSKAGLAAGMIDLAAVKMPDPAEMSQSMASRRMLERRAAV